MEGWDDPRWAQQVPNQDHYADGHIDEFIAHPTMKRKTKIMKDWGVNPDEEHYVELGESSAVPDVFNAHPWFGWSTMANKVQILKERVLLMKTKIDAQTVVSAQEMNDLERDVRAIMNTVRLYKDLRNDVDNHLGELDLILKYGEEWVLVLDKLVDLAIVCVGVGAQGQKYVDRVTREVVTRN